MKYTLTLALSLLFMQQLIAQKKNSKFIYHINQATSEIKVDGVADEKAWQDAQVAQDFYMVLPMDTSLAKVRTEVKMAYDHKNLYILAVCYKAIKGPNMVESLKRDFSFQKNDNFIFFMDTFNDQTSGYSFGANAAGAEWDGTMYEGGKVDLNWTNKWVSAVKDYPDKYVFEAAIRLNPSDIKKESASGVLILAGMT